MSRLEVTQPRIVELPDCGREWMRSECIKESNKSATHNLHTAVDVLRARRHTLFVHNQFGCVQTRTVRAGGDAVFASMVDTAQTVAMVAGASVARHIGGRIAYDFLGSGQIGVAALFDRNDCVETSERECELFVSQNAKHDGCLHPLNMAMHGSLVGHCLATFTWDVRRQA